MAIDRALGAARQVAAEALVLGEGWGGFDGALADCIAGLVGAHTVGFYLVADGCLRLQQPVHGAGVEVLRRFPEIGCSPADGGLASRVLHGGEAFRSAAGGERVRLPAEAAWLEESGLRAPALVRLIGGGQALGLLLVADPAGRSEFGDDDLAVLEAAGAAASIIWEQRRLTGRLVESKAAEADQAGRVAQRMVELERLKGHILNLAAHELRGPLAVIRGYLSMITDQSLDGPGLRRVLPILNAKATQMDALVTQMLEVARLEEGRLEVAREVVDLGAVAREAVDVVALLAPPGLSVFLERPRDPVLVDGDPARIATIVSNLLDNAIKYSPDGGHVRCRLAAEGAEAMLSVADQGVGIAAADMPRLFTKFGRIVTTENSHISGTGLGLHLSRELARLQGGDITAVSEVGRGSAFTLRLPLHAPAGPERDSQATTN